MAGQYSKQKVGFLVLLGLAGCRPDAQLPPQQNPAAVAAVAAGRYQSGDVLCRYGVGAFSQYFRELASAEKRYSHVGIVAVSHDSVFVYHAEASELTGRGGVVKEPLDVFLHQVSTFGLYRLRAHDSIRAQVASRASHYYRRQPAFDLHFNAADDTELYCTELVANCINYAARDSTIRPATRFGSHLLYGLDDIYRSPSVSCVLRSPL